MSRFGWSIDDPRVHILNRSPVGVYVDELVYELLDRLDDIGARRIVVDGYNDLARASPDVTRLNEYLYSLVQRCARSGVSLMLTYETPDLFGISRISDYGISNICDNVILLQLLPDGTELKRVMSVLKSRATAASTAIREFSISTRGIELGQPVSAGRLYRVET